MRFTRPAGSSAIKSVSFLVRTVLVSTYDRPIGSPSFVAT